MKKCYKDDYRSTLQIQEQRRAHYNNKEFVAKMTNEKSEEQRMQTFQEVCCWSLYKMRQGQICSYTLNKFHLIEADFDNPDKGTLMDEEDLPHSSIKCHHIPADCFST